MSKDIQQNNSSNTVITEHCPIMAIVEMGSGHSRRALHFTAKLQVYNSSPRVLLKWIEAKPVADITTPATKKFLWLNIVYLFREPREPILDNSDTVK